MAFRRTRVFAGALVCAWALLALVGAAPATAQETSTIEGLVQVEYPAEAPLSGVNIDRFEAMADGTRGAYVDSVITAADGRYSFEVDPGVWVLTFIAPPGEVWDATGTQWVNSLVSVADGESATVDQDIDIPGFEPVVAVDDAYAFTVGDDVNVDLTQNDTVVRELGNVQFEAGDLPPGMFIGFPDIGGDRQLLRGSPTTPGVYDFQYRVSNERGDSDVGDVRVTIQSADVGAITGTVDIGIPVNSPAGGVQIDLFTAQADGSRGTYVTSTATASDGTYTFPVEPGVWVLTFISPNAEELTWESSGQAWANVLVTVAAGETVTEDQTLVFDLLSAVDDEYTFTVGLPVDVDLSANDESIGQVVSVDGVPGSGDLPPGVEIRFPFIGGAYQTLQGVPTTVGVYNFQYQVMNEFGGSDVGDVTVTVEAGDFGAVAGEVIGLPPDETVTIDVFAALPDGSRGDYLESVVVDGPSQFAPGGTYLLQLDPGDYVLTFISPNPQSTWLTTGTRFADVPVTAVAGEFQTLDDQVLQFRPPTDPGTIAGTVTIGFPVDGPASGVQVDLFTAQADGSRGVFVASTVADDDGNYSFEVIPGVWVLTFISPDPANLTFESSGQPWANVLVAVGEGETVQADQLLVFDLVQPVDDEYEFVVGELVVVDLTANDLVIRNVTDVDFESGDLPPGMDIAFDVIGGVYPELRGTPTTPGVYQFQYRVTNDNGTSDVGNVTVTVVGP